MDISQEIQRMMIAKQRKMVTETLTEMGRVGMVLEMVTVALVVMVVVMAQAGSGNR